MNGLECNGVRCSAFRPVKELARAAGAESHPDNFGSDPMLDAAAEEICHNTNDELKNPTPDLTCPFLEITRRALLPNIVNQGGGVE